KRSLSASRRGRRLERMAWDGLSTTVARGGSYGTTATFLVALHAGFIVDRPALRQLCPGVDRRAHGAGSLDPPRLRRQLRESLSPPRKGMAMTRVIKKAGVPAPAATETTVAGAEGRPGTPRVVVLGGGVAGLTAAYELRRRLRDHAQITLIAD